MKKFEVANHKNYDRFNIWFNFCVSAQIPYVMVKNRIKYSEITWDFINFEGELRKKFMNRNDTTNRDMAISIFKKYACKKSEYTVNGHIFSFKDIPIENSEKLAEEIFDLINNYLK